MGEETRRDQTPSRLTRWWYLNRAFLRIGVLDALSYPLSFLSGRLSVVVPLVAFSLISEFLAPDGRADEYFAFVVVGLVVAAILDAGTRGMSDRLGTEINTGRLEMYLTEPVPTTFLPVGLVQFDLFARILTAAIVAGLSVPLGARYVYGWPNVLAALVLVLGLLATMSIALTGSSVKILAKRADPLLTVYSLGAQIFGGVYFPVDQLPGFLQPFSWLFPHTFVIAVARRLVLPRGGIADGGPATATAVVALVAIIAVMGPLGVWTFRRAVAYGRQRGLLSGY